MSKEQNRKIFKTAFDYLQEIKPPEVDLDRYFLGDSCDFKTLTDVYIRFIQSAQNYQAMPNIINFSERQEEISSILQGFDYQKIAEMSEEKLYKTFRNKFHVTTTDQKKNSWYKWSCSVIDSAKFICGFTDTTDFDKFIKLFDYNPISRMALPLLIQKKIRGIGFALACDLLKELGYTSYPKPDVHLITVFKEAGICKGDPISVYEAIVQMASDCNETPYKVDKVFWLICSGNYYHDKIKEESHKEELIVLLKQVK